MSRTFNSYAELAAAPSHGAVLTGMLQHPTTDNMTPPLIPVKEIDGYNFSMYGNEGNRPHVHVDAPGNKRAEFWLSPQISVKDPGNMRPNEQKATMKLIEPNQDTFVEQFEAVKAEMKQGQVEDYNGKTVPKSGQESRRKQKRGRTYQQPDEIQPDS